MWKGWSVPSKCWRDGLYNLGVFWQVREVVVHFPCFYGSNKFFHHSLICLFYLFPYSCFDVNFQRRVQLDLLTSIGKGNHSPCSGLYLVICDLIIPTDGIPTLT